VNAATTDSRLTARIARAAPIERDIVRGSPGGEDERQESAVSAGFSDGAGSVIRAVSVSCG
jgi:hypothetical protein